MSIENWNEDSILSRAGYTADGTQSKNSRRMRINRAIAGREECALEVLRHLRWLVDHRGDRLPKAQRIWRDDMEYVCRVINDGLPGDAVAVRFNISQLQSQQEAQRDRSKDILSGHR